MSYVFSEKYVVFRVGHKLPVASGSIHLRVPMCPLFAVVDFWGSRSGARCGDAAVLCRYC